MQPFPLEQWIHAIVRPLAGTRDVSRKEIEAYQLSRLRQTLRYAYANSSFYRELFDKAGAVQAEINGLGDLTRLPFTEPRHLAETPYRFLCVSQAEVARPCSFVTSGTTGPQKRVFWSRSDLERIIEFMAAGIATVAGTEDVIHIMLADGRTYSQADLLARGVAKLGATPVISAMELGAEEQLQAIRTSGSTVLFGYTGQLFRMSKELQEKHDLTTEGVKVLFAAGEYLPDAMRRELRAIWNCPVFTHYGLTEMGLGVAVECAAHQGYHFNEAGLLLEVVDPVNGETVPPGEEGELVFTTLVRQAMPLIRYRTHDISRIILEPCSCGATTLRRIDFVRKRLESIVRLQSGDSIYPSLFDDVLFEIQGPVDYRIVLRQVGHRDRLDLQMEMLRPQPDALACVRSRLLSIPAIERAIVEGNMLEPTIQVVNCGSLGSSGMGKKLIVTSIPTSSL
jgi:phenylacetate-CoA ligase